MGYPASAGSAALRERRRDGSRRASASRSSPSHVGACVGTKEFVASLPHLLRLRDPRRDTVLYPAVAYPTLRDGRDARPAAARCRCPLDAAWHLDLDAVSADDAERALVLWVNEPGNPTGLGRRRRRASVAIAAWARERGIVVASDECYVEFAPEPATILAPGSTACSRCTACRSARTWPACACGFYAGDPELVDVLVETRKHAGFMVPTPVQAAAAAALGDDEHVAEQRHAVRGTPQARDRRPRRARPRARRRSVHLLLWLRAETGADDGWEIAARLAHAGMLVSPGDLYGAAGADHVRLALVQPAERLQLALDRLDCATARRTKGQPWTTTAKQVTQLWEAGDAGATCCRRPRRTTSCAR